MQDFKYLCHVTGSFPMQLSLPYHKHAELCQPMLPILSYVMFPTLPSLPRSNPPIVHDQLPPLLQHAPRPSTLNLNLNPPTLQPFLSISASPLPLHTKYFPKVGPRPQGTKQIFKRTESGGPLQSATSDLTVCALIIGLVHRALIMTRWGHCRFWRYPAPSQ